jgi:hypothetical protein
VIGNDTGRDCGSGLDLALRAFIGPTPEQPSVCTQRSSADVHGQIVVSFAASQRYKHRIQANGYRHMYEFSVLPSRQRPRWLLPTEDPRTMMSGLQMYTPFAFRARLLKRSLLAMIMFGWTGWIRAKVLIASRKPLPLQAMVTEVTGEQQPAFALSIGNRESLRALTVQVMRPSGDVLGYIKLPLTAAAAERIRHEASVLNRLWDRFPPLHQHIPRVLYSGEGDCGFILFQSSGPRAPGPHRFGVLHKHFLEQLWQVEPVNKAGQALVEEVSARWRQAQPRMGTEWRNLGQASLEEAGRRLGGTTVACGVMHGDFAPWNTRQEKGHLFVFDWESARWVTPRLWDAFHFNEQVTNLLHQERIRYAECDLTSPTHNALLLLYRLHSVCEALEAGGPHVEAKIKYHKLQTLCSLQQMWSARSPL